MNDGSGGGLQSPVRRAYERLLRKLLSLPHRPAVVLLQTFRGFERNSPCALPPGQMLIHRCGDHRCTLTIPGEFQ